jgi:hypothetical protein
MKIRTGLVCIVTLIVIIISCKKTTYNYPANPLTNYFMPLQVGKFSIYRLDSLNFYFYGQIDTVSSYLAKDSVEKMGTDNAGHQVWFVTRYLSDTTGASWTPTQTYTVTPSVQTLEIVENNLRFIKLAFPMDEGFSWTGNTYLPANPYQDFFVFSDNANVDMGLWNYTYQNVNTPVNISGIQYDSSVTVLQINDSINVPVVIDTIFATRTYWSETYAKHVGLVYRHTEMWERQPPTPNGTQQAYKIGFQLTMRLVSHN